MSIGLRSKTLLICIFLAIDFLINLYRFPDWRDYLIRQGGWLDLLGSVPIIVGPLWTAVFRLARLPRLIRIVRDLRARSPQQIRQALRSNRPKGALLLTFLIAIVMIAVAGAVVLQVEGRSPEANIHTGGDAFWWAFVTITTVGYGDMAPKTPLGQSIASMIMILGYSIIAIPTGIVTAEMVRKEVRDDMNARACPDCLLEGHALDALFCKKCGSKLNP